MELGIVGTRLGMNVAQTMALEHLLVVLRPSAVLHNDEFGTAHAIHRVAVRTGLYIAVHPSSNTSRRVFATARYNDYKNCWCGPEVSDAKYHKILLSECSAVIVVPGEDVDAAADNLRKKGMETYTLNKDGTVLVFSTAPAPAVAG